MRPKSLNSYAVRVPRSLSSPQTLKDPLETSLRSRRRRGSTEITITPLRGFLIALIFLGIPSVSLGTLCFSLLQSNLRLSQENSELEEIATEVRQDIESLGEEIDTLRARAGVEAGKDSSEGLLQGRLDKAPAKPPQSASTLAGVFLPKGGLIKEARAIDLLKDARQQVPQLNKALSSAVAPLEKTLAQEAAFPSGQPVVGKAEISSEFGVRSNPFGGGSYEVHEGMDFVGEQGDIIAATGDGVVTLAGANGGYGNTVTLDHGHGYETLYAHMSEVRVKVGDRVKRGQIIGYIGSTGRSSGPHLHYSVYKDEKAIDPRKVLKLSE